LPAKPLKTTGKNINPELPRDYLITFHKNAGNLIPLFKEKIILSML